MRPLKRTKGGKKRRKKERKKRIPGARWEVAPFLAPYTLEGVRSRAFVHSSASLSLFLRRFLSRFPRKKKKNFRGVSVRGFDEKVDVRRKRQKHPFFVPTSRFYPTASLRTLRILFDLVPPSPPLSCSTTSYNKDNSLYPRLDGRSFDWQDFPPFHGTLKPAHGFPRAIKSLPLPLPGKGTKKISRFMKELKARRERYCAFLVSKRAAGLIVEKWSSKKRVCPCFRTVSIICHVNSNRCKTRGQGSEEWPKQMTPRPSLISLRNGSKWQNLLVEGPSLPSAELSLRIYEFECVSRRRSVPKLRKASVHFDETTRRLHSSNQLRFFKRAHCIPRTDLEHVRSLPFLFPPLFLPPSRR